jgi:fatty acid desaturase
MSIAHDHHHDHGHDHDHDYDLDHDDIAKPPRDPGTPVKWYRIKLTREQLSELNRKSDLKGFAQTLGYLGTLALTGAFFVYACFALPWYVAVLAFIVHGAVGNFLVNGFHELIHESVFKTRWLNGFFLRIFSFLGWYNHVHFWASHTEHHKFTLHPPDDLEVVLPQKMRLWWFLNFAIVDYKGFYYTLKGVLGAIKSGKSQSQWDAHLFPESKPELRRALLHWARIVYGGHFAIIVVAIATGYWPVALAVSVIRFTGGGLHYLCNASQHIGLVDNVPDFRVCCRTIYLNPLVQFLYWHMNYHTEHHMYAGVPCYNLPKLHRLIKHEMPDCPRGLYRTWRLVAASRKRQDADPTYQYLPKLPTPVHLGPGTTSNKVE